MSPVSPLSLSVAVLDVGGAKNTGWHRTGPDGDSQGNTINGLCHQAVRDLDAGLPLALGFESPLWIPYATDSAVLGKARPGEAGVGTGRSRAWSASAGAAVATYGLQQVVYVLHHIATEVATRPWVTLDPEQLRTGAADLLLWEAFVSGRAKTGTHAGDAEAAAVEFIKRWQEGPIESDIQLGAAVSLAGFAANATGLAADFHLLTTPAVVVAAPDRF